MVQWAALKPLLTNQSNLPQQVQGSRQCIPVFLGGVCMGYGHLSVVYSRARC